MRINIRSITKGIRHCQNNSNGILEFIKFLYMALRSFSIEGQLVSSGAQSSDSRIYVIQNGQKRWLHSYDMIEGLDLNDKSIHYISSTHIKRLKDGPPIFPSTSKWGVRKEVSKEFLRGKGIEIGAFHNALWTTPQTNVCYIDLPPEKSSIKNAPPSTIGIVPVDVFDDGEVLSSIDDDSIDFIIANHFIEHCINPLGTIRNHLNKIHAGGFLFYAIPNCQKTFDKQRAITTFEHLIKDDKYGGDISKREHYLDLAKHVAHIDPQDQIEHALKLEQDDKRIHFHVWDADAIKDFLERASDYFDGAFSIKKMIPVDNEVVCLCQKEC